MHPPLAPGSILAGMYLRRRMRRHRAAGKTFLEVGSGDGVLSGVLLDLGLSGIGVDLNPEACRTNRERNRVWIERGRYAVVEGHFFELTLATPVDMIVACMVIEHLTEPEEEEFFRRGLELLRPGGSFVLFVPAEQKYWGIEDEIAGHQRRYSRGDLRDRGREHGLAVGHLAGLTYPVSNLLRPLSNALVRAAESDRLGLSHQERTIRSGHRHVPMKTSFPAIFAVVLNELVMAPFHWMQLAFSGTSRAMVLYAELVKPDTIGHNAHPGNGNEADESGLAAERRFQGYDSRLECGDP